MPEDARGRVATGAPIPAARVAVAAVFTPPPKAPSPVAVEAGGEAPGAQLYRAVVGLFERTVGRPLSPAESDELRELIRMGVPYSHFERAFEMIQAQNQLGNRIGYPMAYAGVIVNKTLREGLQSLDTTTHSNPAVAYLLNKQDIDHRPVRLSPDAQDKIASAVADLALWFRVVDAWHLSSYKMTNVAGLLDWYRNPQKVKDEHAANSSQLPSGRGGTTHQPTRFVEFPAEQPIRGRRNFDPNEIE